MTNDVTDIERATLYIAQLFGLFVYQIKDSVINCYRDDNGQLYFIDNSCECSLKNCARCLPALHLNHHAKQHDYCRPCLNLRKIFYAQRKLLQDFKHLIPCHKSLTPETPDNYSFRKQKSFSCLFGGYPNTYYPGLRLVSCTAYI